MPTTTATTAWTSIKSITVGEGTNAAGKAVPQLGSDIIVYQEEDPDSDDENEYDSDEDT